jgi:hypothetical protein
LATAAARRGAETRIPTFAFCLLPFAFYRGRKLRTESSVVSREDSHREKNLPATSTAGYRDAMKHFKFTLRDLFWLVQVVGLSLGWVIDHQRLSSALQWEKATRVPDWPQGN